jgi:hypothetical protein
MTGTNPCRRLWQRIIMRSAFQKPGAPAEIAGKLKPANRRPRRKIAFLEIP